jgi:peptidylprolyl isomerase
MRTALALSALLALAAPSLVLAAAPAKNEAPKPTPPPDLRTPPADAQRSESGLIWRQLAPGTGTVHPAATDYVKVRYSLWTVDGKLIESIPSSQLAILSVANLVPGWREGVLTMTEGEQRRMWISEALGASPRVTPGGMVIDTELVSILHPPQTPAEVSAAPADAIRTKSGLAYKVLRPGTGTKHPKSSSFVRVHYSGWTTDGKMFDSSVLRGTPAEFSLQNVIAGWTEGLQLMVEGEQARFWIPAKLAYASDPTKPQGMLVFDIELIAVR